MKLRFPVDDPHLLQNLLSIANGAVEGPGANYRIQVGRITLSCTANTLATQRITFNPKYLAGTIPFVLVSLSSPSALGATVTASSASETYQGFVIQTLSTSNQTVTLVWAAIGQTG